MVDPEEVADVIGDLSWLRLCTCCVGRSVDEFFVEAGHNLGGDVLMAARLCPTRRQEVIWAYTIGGGIEHGHFGGLSPGQRRRMSLEEALEFIVADTEAAAAEQAAASATASASGPSPGTV